MGKWESHLPRSPQDPRLGLLFRIQVLACVLKHFHFFCLVSLLVSPSVYLAPQTRAVSEDFQGGWKWPVTALSNL